MKRVRTLVWKRMGCRLLLCISDRSTEWQGRGDTSGHTV